MLAKNSIAAESTIQQWLVEICQLLNGSVFLFPSILWVGWGIGLVDHVNNDCPSEAIKPKGTVDNG